jgi:hypothetical protein
MDGMPTMTMVAEIDDSYSDVRARKDLARAVDAYGVKAAELAALRTTIKQAESRLASMKTEIDESADVEVQVADAAADALRRGGDVSDRSQAWKAKQDRDALIAEHELLSSGLLRLQARAIAAEREANAELVELHRCREPIIQHMIDALASEVAIAEKKAMALRARLHGFSLCPNGATPQRLSSFARGLLINQPANVMGPQINSPAAREVAREREIFRNWKTALESDANAQLNL